MLDLTSDGFNDQEALSISDFKETNKLINSSEFKQRNLFPTIATELINKYNKNPYLQLDPRKCCLDLSNLNTEEILYNYAYLDFWQSINHKSQYALDNYYQLNDNKLQQDINSHKQYNTLIKTESQSNKLQPDLIDDMYNNLDHSKTCISCGRKCRYLMYILIPPLTNGNLSSIFNNCDLSECIWCPRCYSCGRIPPPLTRNHFSKIQIPFEFSDKNSIPWTRSQIQLLIDAINTYNDDWESIAKHVDKSPHECILKFSQLPIEDLIIKGSNFDGCTNVFGNTPNEFLAYLAFISNSISPVISSGGAKSALEILLSDNYQETNGMYKDETLKIAFENAKQSAQKNAEVLADLEHQEIKKLLKDIYDLELQIINVQTEKFEILNQKITECTESMANYLISKS